MKIETILAVFVVTCLYTGTTGHRYRTLPVFRRQSERTICNSYGYFRSRLQRETNPLIDNFVNSLFDQSPITGEMLRSMAAGLCSDIVTRATMWIQENRPTSPCLATETVSNMMEVYSGLCTGEGAVTAFFYNLTSDIESVNIPSWTSPCMTKMIQILISCPFLSVGRFTGLEGGPAIHERQMQESFRCVFAEIDDNDTSMCGDTTSVKKFYLLIELLLNLSPGTNFTVSYFGL